jgi:predicted nuclease of predicted toxin-antitoxin system
MSIMATIRLLANMNISPKTVEALQHAGWDIVRVSQFLPVNASDEEILALARRQGRAMVTQDLDFSALLALGGRDRPSLITRRLATSDPETLALRLLDELPHFKQVVQEGSVMTIEDVAVRVRKLPIG